MSCINIPNLCTITCYVEILGGKNVSLDSGADTVINAAHCESSLLSRASRLVSTVLQGSGIVFVGYAINAFAKVYNEMK